MHRDWGFGRCKIALIFAGVALAGAPALADGPPVGDVAVEQTADRWSAAFSSQAQYYSWESTLGYPAGGATSDGEGSQIYIPVALQLTGQVTDVLALEFMVRSGYLRSRQSAGGVTSETRGITDTSLGATVSYSGLESFLQFIPAKTRWSVGLAGQYALGETLALSTAVSRIWVGQNESPDKTALGPGSGIPEINTDAWLVTIGASWQF